MANAEPEQKKVRLELLDGTVEVTGTEEFVRKAQSLFIRLTGDVKDMPQLAPPLAPPINPMPQSLDSKNDQAITDIRTLKDVKQPRTQIEMAALVAYYVSELAAAGERRDTITADDITRYFGQAGYRSTSPPRIVLSNTKTAGYLDSPATGQYRLNPVGYNLVTAGMPATGEQTRRSTGRKKSRGTKKSSARKVNRKKAPARKAAAKKAAAQE